MSPIHAPTFFSRIRKKSRQPLARLPNFSVTPLEKENLAKEATDLETAS